MSAPAVRKPRRSGRPGSGGSEVAGPAGVRPSCGDATSGAAVRGRTTESPATGPSS
jgi:hypothetical protein